MPGCRRVVVAGGLAGRLVEDDEPGPVAVELHPAGQRAGGVRDQVGVLGVGPAHVADLPVDDRVHDAGGVGDDEAGAGPDEGLHADADVDGPVADMQDVAGRPGHLGGLGDRLADDRGGVGGAADDPGCREGADHREGGDAADQPTPAPHPPVAGPGEGGHVRDGEVHGLGLLVQQGLQLLGHRVTTRSKRGSSSGSFAEPLAELGDAGGHLALHGAHGAAHRLGGLGLGQVLVVAQHDRGPLPRGQSQQRLPQPGALRAPPRRGRPPRSRAPGRWVARATTACGGTTRSRSS